MSSEFTTLVECFRRRVDEQPSRHAFIFLADGELQEHRLTYRDLDVHARAIAARLQTLVKPGDRVMLFFPPGLDIISAFMGCLYAGVVAVPSSLPNSAASANAVQSIASDARPAAVLTNTLLLSPLQSRLDSMPAIKELEWLPVDTLRVDLADDWVTPALPGDALAVLHYASHSIQPSLGVMFSYANLDAALAQAQEAYPADANDLIVSIESLSNANALVRALIALSLGIPRLLIPPAAFMERPLRWLRAITRYKGTLSGGPSSAYQLCVDRTSVEERRGLELSTWKLALLAYEPASASTLEQFAGKFSACGFRQEAFCSLYGLSETATFVSGGCPPTVLTLDRSALRNYRVALTSPEDNRALTLVGCGKPLPNVDIRIVDHRKRTPSSADAVGEVWISGPCVAPGYWNRVEETENTFHGRSIVMPRGHYLRTGDLGFMRDGILYIVGRLRDIIILHGKSHNSQEIEESAGKSHPALQQGAAAAFSIPGADGGEELVIVHEVKPNQNHLDVKAIAQAIRLTVAQDLEVPVHAVVLVKPGHLPRTPSGRILRQQCRADYVAGRTGYAPTSQATPE